MALGGHSGVLLLLLTLGRLVADDEAVNFSQAGCPLQQSFGIGHTDSLKLYRRSRNCSGETIHHAFFEPKEQLKATVRRTDCVPVVITDTSASLWALPCAQVTLIM